MAIDKATLVSGSRLFVSTRTATTLAAFNTSPFTVGNNAQRWIEAGVVTNIGDVTQSSVVGSIRPINNDSVLKAKSKVLDHGTFTITVVSTDSAGVAALRTAISSTGAVSVKLLIEANRNGGIRDGATGAPDHNVNDDAIYYVGVLNEQGLSAGDDSSFYMQTFTLTMTRAPLYSA